MRSFIFLLPILFFSSGLKGDLLSDYTKSKKVIIIYGENAPDLEKKIAYDLLKTLELENLEDDLYDRIITDTYALKHQFFYASFHLIVIGTVESNMLCLNSAEIQLGKFKKEASPFEVVSELSLIKKGFYSSYYGFYPDFKEIGYVRRVLNPFTLQAFNISEGKAVSSPYTVTYISGSDSAGVQKAYINFVDNKMLQGAVIPTANLKEKNSRFQLSQKSMDFVVNKTINTKFQLKAGDDNLVYKGWIQGTVADFGGVKELSGESAQHINHLKFSGNSPQLLTYDEQVNTVLQIGFNDEAAAIKAIKEINRKKGLLLKINEAENFEIYPCSNGDRNWYMVRHGQYLYIENFSENWQELFVKNIKEFIKN